MNKHKANFLKGKVKNAVHVLKHDGIFTTIKKTVDNYRRYKMNPEDYFAINNINIDHIPFDAEYQDDVDYSKYESDIKTLAFYLPQYHTFAENDQWWGRGFTEWTNTRKCCVPRFDGHYQPRTPHKDIGYYDLSDFSVLEQQINLAKKHGIYGFCFYYYWFSGKRLMEKPVDMLLMNEEVDFPFCLCWANENWTRAWDGMNKDVLIEQKYSEDDIYLFIKDIKKYIDDKRYIKIDGKPLLMVYNPGEIPNCGKVFNGWRKYAKELGIGEILIWVCATANNCVKSLKLSEFVDAEVEFPPHNMWLNEFAVRNVDCNGKNVSMFDYHKLVEYQIEKLSCEDDNCVPIHHACTLGWDNSSRREDNWFNYYNFSLYDYYRWLRAIVINTRKTFNDSERFIFINAWNEWAEGTYLEPDEKYGYSYINTTSKALFDIPYAKMPKVFFTSKISNEFDVLDDVSEICIQIHLFYIETMEEMVSYINNVKKSFDCYISTDTEEKKVIIEKYFLENCRQKKLYVDVIENRGRDVRPFILQLRNVLRKYKYVGHIHSKMTKTGTYGNEWRNYCYKHLLGNSKYVDGIFDLLKNEKKIGILFPPVFPPLINQAEWGGNYDGAKILMSSINCDYDLPNKPVFPVGNMFWAKTEAIFPMFERLNLNLFPKEDGQVNGTIAHCIERVWVYIAKSLGYDYEYIYNYEIQSSPKQLKRIVFFVHYDSNNVVSDNDINYIKSLKNMNMEVVVISNNNQLSTKYVELLNSNADHVIIRENKGYDFAAWKCGMENYGYDVISKYDEVILVNNSVIGPVYNLNNIFTTMEDKKCDFWGLTLFPRMNDGSYLNLDYIPEHIQSYFMVFNQNVVVSNVFRDFWSDLSGKNDFVETVACYESQLTKILNKAGYKHAVYIEETKYIIDMLGDAKIPYVKPWLLLLLGMPFVKKKYSMYCTDEDKILTESYTKLLNYN